MTEEGTLAILDQSGDRKITYRLFKSWFKKQPEDKQREVLKELNAITALVEEPADVKQARQEFDDKIAAGYDAYALSGDNKRKISKFDPREKFILMTPKLYSGK
jgi:hypothetical protein